MNKNEKNMAKGVGDNEPEKEVELNSNETKNPEALSDITEKNLDTKVESLENNADIIEKKVEELGGVEGINQILDKMSEEERKLLQQKIEEQKEIIKESLESLDSSYGGIERKGRFGQHVFTTGNFTDRMWYNSKESLSNILDFSDDDSLTDSVSRVLSDSFFGSIGLSLSAPKKLVDTIIRRIKLSSEKRKLAEMEKQAV
ncbi:MAG: hypothetical protein NT068_03385 [Candidatus Nomurabacteria bacterium]|nr:hypothetical protein [Candidatus Nomurabacteria bacterium]